tara:strand:+ start:1773 stop:2531 length:759 start_codon:yes stop_codon:yes gene_type:complete
MKFIILGCGSSMGVPRPDGFFGKCNPKNQKNFRTRCSAFIKTSKENILIDTSPDLRKQLLSNKIKYISRVFYTHNHADQTHGINDLRVFFLKNKKKIPVYVNKSTKNYLNKSFSYCFKNYKDYPATLKFLEIKNRINFGKTLSIEAIPVRHGYIQSLSFIINKKIAYLPDANEIYKKDFKRFMNLKYIVIDCLRYKQHPSHFNLDDILRLNVLLRPKKMILTNLHSDLDYDDLLNILPKNIKPAYDGLSIKL